MITILPPILDMKLKRSSKLNYLNLVIICFTLFNFNKRGIVLECLQQYFNYKMDLNHLNNDPTPIKYPYKYILISYIVIRYIILQYINFRQLKRNLITQIPKQVAQLGTTFQQFLLSQAYSTDKLTFQMLCLSIKTCLECLLLMANVRAFVWEHLDSIFPFIDKQSQFQRALAYSLILMFIAKAFKVPLQAYQMEIIDKKHKRVSKTLTNYLYDLVVEGMLALLVLSPVLYGYLRVVQYGGDSYYIFLQIFVFVVTIIYAQIYPYATIFFNKFKDISNPQLLNQIKNLALKTSFPANQIRIKIDGEYDYHGAEYHGIGNKHFIGIYESLLTKLNIKQISGVVCHQMGHWYYLHSLKSLFFYLIQNIALFYLYTFFVNYEDVFLSFGFPQKQVKSVSSRFLGTALFYELHSPLISIFYFITLVMKRYFEFQSDSYAVRLGYGKELKKSLIKLYKDNAPKIRPDYIYAWIHYTHPTLWERIESIDKLIAEEEDNMEKWLHLN